MRNTIWNKRIPTLLSVLLIIIGIVITSLLVKSGVIFISRATPSQVPQDIRITNISDSSFTVTYTTEDNVIGSVNFGKDKNLGQSALDERDQVANSVSPHTVHSITITNLKPSSSYFFSITSGQNTFLNNNEPFQVSTGELIQATPSSQMPLAGNIILPDGSKLTEALVYASVDGGQTVSALAKQDGSYILPLNSLRTTNLSSYFNFNNNSIIKMLIANNSLKSNVFLSKEQVSPVPTITLSKDYDFTSSQEPVASISAQPSSGLFSTLSAQPSSKGQTTQILTPKKDEGFSDQQPLFKGTGQPNQSVKVIIHSSENIQTTVTADSFGNWSYRPSQPLSPGEHMITIQAPDSSGIIKTITQSFIVYASGTQVSQSATPSATLTPPATSIATPTLIATPTPTPSPTLMPQPTITPIPTPIQAKAKEVVPPTGPSNIVILGIVGIGITAISFLLFLLTRGKITSV